MIPAFFVPGFLPQKEEERNPLSDYAPPSGESYWTLLSHTSCESDSRNIPCSCNLVCIVHEQCYRIGLLIVKRMLQFITKILQGEPRQIGGMSFLYTI